MSSSLFQKQNQNQSQNLMSNFTSEQIQTVKNLLGGGRVSAEQMVRNICQQRGIDADEFVKGLGGNTG